MSFDKDKNGILDLPTTRRQHRERFSVSFDSDEGVSDPTLRSTKVVFLHVPDMNEAAHEHIELTDASVALLETWLHAYREARKQK